MVYLVLEIFIGMELIEILISEWALTRGEMLRVQPRSVCEL